MEYINAIRGNFVQIVGQVNGQMVTENTGREILTALFPNYRLQTRTGKPFNVMGIIQLADLSGAVKNTVCLVYEPSAAMLRNPDTCDFNDMGTLFIVGEQGRIYNKQAEIELLGNFLVFKDLFRDKYHATPGFPMFLSEEQVRLLRQMQS